MSLLDREARSRLPLARQILLYLDPFALFQDASRGSARVRESALSYNRAMRWMLLPYLRRWGTITVTLFLSISPAQAALPSEVAAIPTAALAIGCCVAATVVSVTVAVYLLLGGRNT